MPSIAELVIGGLYRHVRNPMYLAVGAAITGQSLLLAQPVLLGFDDLPPGRGRAVR